MLNNPTIHASAGLAAVMIEYECNNVPAADVYS